MAVRVDVAPALLYWAIERAGMTVEEAIDRIPEFRTWETGEVQPTLKQLEHFANVTHVPLGMLFLEDPPVETIPIPDMRTMGNRAVPRPSANLLDTIYLCQARQDWYRDYAVENEIPGPGFVGSASLEDSPIVVARHIRGLLNLDVGGLRQYSTRSEARRALIDRIEEVGVLVMVNGIVGANPHRKLNAKEFRGFALVDDLAPLIFVNRRDTESALIFTLIHELAHIFLGASALSDATPAPVGGLPEELWCNQVAAEVLVPLKELESEYRGSVAIAELDRLSRIFGVSTLVILKRMFDSRLLTWEVYRARYEQETARLLEFLEQETKRESGGDFYNTHPLRISRQFARAVISSTFEGSTLYRDAYQLLGTTKYSTFENLAVELGVG